MWILQSDYSNIETFYPTLKNELFSLVEGEKNLIANLANISSWIHHSMPDLNWSGFYLWSDEDKELVLGPFQGKPACIRIKPERGVCGASYRNNKVIGVLDLDSPKVARFSARDEKELSEIINQLAQKIL